MKKKNDETKDAKKTTKPTTRSDVSNRNEKTLQKTSSLCDNLKNTRTLDKNPKKVATNLKKVSRLAILFERYLLFCCVKDISVCLKVFNCSFYFYECY